MARIAGVDLPRNKRMEIALTYIYGIGRSSARHASAPRPRSSPAARRDDLTDDEVTRIRREIDANYKVEGDLRRDITGNIKRLVDLGCYRGLRHRRNLPVRGQRTHTNSRTRKGPRRRSPARRRRPRRAEQRGRRRTPSKRKEDSWQSSRKPAARRAPRPKATPVRRKKAKRLVAEGVLHIHSTFNNTIITVSDPQGNVLVWASAGSCGLQGLAQGDALRGAGGGRGRGAQGGRAGHAARARSW